jgi:hypothetical protein
MTRQLPVVVAIAALLMFPGRALAQKGGGSHGASHGSSASKGSGSSKPVHVKAYTKKDGTTVEAHDRKAPTPTGEQRAAETSTGASPIRIYTDPVTGVRTFTNAPLPASPTLQSKALPTTTTAAPTHRATTTAGHVTTARRPRTSTTAVAVPHAAGVRRSANGKGARSEAAKHRFESQTGYPHGRPGYMVDHIKPLACGGADAPFNMQWQTVAQAKAKDKVERVGCR